MAARPATRSRRPRRPPSRRRRASATCAGPSSGPIVEWDVRTAYDFVFALSDDAGSTDDLPPADRAWLADGKARAASAAGRRASTCTARSCASSWPAWRSTVPRSPTPRASSSSSRLRRMTRSSGSSSGEDLRDPDRAEIAERAIAGDAAAIEADGRAPRRTRPRARQETWLIAPVPRARARSSSRPVAVLERLAADVPGDRGARGRDDPSATSTARADDRATLDADRPHRADDRRDPLALEPASAG